jgi:hypothetical protein
MNHRPYLNSTTKGLEAVSEMHWSNRFELLVVAQELAHRTRGRARALKKRVDERLDDLRRNETPAELSAMPQPNPAIPTAPRRPLAGGGGDGPKEPSWEDQRLFERIATLYEGSIRVPVNETCRTRCDAKHVRPLLPWHIGDLYSTDSLRLVIIGKPHREDKETADRQAGTQDGRATARRLFETTNWNFWAYTKDILRTVFGSEEKGWRRTVITTIVKCTNSSPDTGWNDQTTEKMKIACVQDNRVIQRELGILLPRTIVLYTARAYDDCIADLAWTQSQRWQNLTSQSHTVSCGDVALPWWERRLVGERDHVQVLRTGHPGRKPREFITLVSGWLRKVEQERRGESENN